MNYLKVRKDLLFAYNPLLILLGILLFFYLPQLICSAFYVFWIGLACVFWLVVSSHGSQRLAEQAEVTAERLSWQAWWVCIIVLELSLFGVYSGISYLCGEGLAVNGSILAHLFSQSLQTQLLYFGLFPWTFYALVAVCMGKLAFRQQIHAYFSNLLKPITRQDPQEVLGIIINISARRATLFGLSILLTFMILLLTSFVLTRDTHLAVEFQPPTLIVTLILLVFSFSDTARHYLNRLFSRRVPTLLSIPVFCVVMSLILLLLSAMAIGLTSSIGDGKIPLIIQRWIDYHQDNAWKIFSVIFWICLTPMVSSYLAHISKGYRIRHVLLGVLVLPITTGFSLMMASHLQIEIPSPSALTIKLLALISFLMMFTLLLNQSHLSNAIDAYFPKNGLIKIRDQNTFFYKIAQLTILDLSVYLVIGINGISVLYFALNYLMVLMVVAIPFVLM